MHGGLVGPVIVQRVAQPSRTNKPPCAASGSGHKQSSPPVQGRLHCAKKPRNESAAIALRALQKRATAKATATATAKTVRLPRGSIHGRTPVKAASRRCAAPLRSGPDSACTLPVIRAGAQKQQQQQQQKQKRRPRAPRVAGIPTGRGKGELKPHKKHLTGRAPRDQRRPEPA